MELITYRKTLDVHKNGIQFTLQGFETADNMSRRLEISLMASGDAIDFPLENVVAQMYITTPSAKEPSIEHCTIRDNVVVYDVLPIVEEGITEMQIKLIGASVGGAKRVLTSPRFAVEVLKSNADDTSAVQSTTFTALEDAVAKANAVYNARLVRVEFDEKCIFRAYYADGTIYETDAIKEGLMKGSTLLSKSYAVGGTGAREEEATDNSKYYSNVSRSSAIEAREGGELATDMLTEVRKHGVYTAFDMDFEKGELQYVSPSYDFAVNPDSGELDVIGKASSFEEAVEEIVAEDIADDVAQIIRDTLLEAFNDLPEINPNIAVYADDLGKDYASPTLVRWDRNTAHTPYASSLTANTDGFAIIHGSLSGNHTIIAWVTGDEDNYHIHTVSGGVDKGWSGYLHKSGGNLSGPLGVDGGKGKFSANDEYSIIDSVKDGDNSRQIRVANPGAESIPLADAVKFSDIIGGVKTDYKLFGEHNIASLIGAFGLGQIEYGTFKGIGLQALQNGIAPSIEFKHISPVLVIIFEEGGFHFFPRSQEYGTGRYRFTNLRFLQTWEEKKLTFRHSDYSNSAGSNTYPPAYAGLTETHMQYYLAKPNTTYTYIAFGGVLGGEAE